MERVKGIEPSSVAWKATALPLSYTRVMLSVPSAFVLSAFAPWVVVASAFAKASAGHPPPALCLPAASFSARSRRSLGGGGWWRGLDSNQRRRSQRIYSPSPLATRAPLRISPIGLVKPNSSPVSVLALISATGFVLT